MSKKTFWILSFTWGLPQTLLGCIVALLFLITGHKPHKWGYCVYFVTKHKGYAGCEFGAFFVINDGGEGCRDHEFGHALQSCRYGGLFCLLAIFIPGVVRYWIREFKERVLKLKLGNYDKWYFEGQASRVGKLVREQIDNGMM